MASNGAKIRRMQLASALTQERECGPTMQAIGHIRMAEALMSKPGAKYAAAANELKKAQKLLSGTEVPLELDIQAFAFVLYILAGVRILAKRRIPKIEYSRLTQNLELYYCHKFQYMQIKEACLITAACAAEEFGHLKCLDFGAKIPIFLELREKAQLQKKGEWATLPDIPEIRALITA